MAQDQPANCQFINVFPVPDGDTGTNMMLTMTSAWNEIKDSGEKHAGKIIALVAKGALMGARGNSGVIFPNCGAVLRVQHRIRQSSMRMCLCADSWKRVIPLTRVWSSQWREPF